MSIFNRKLGLGILAALFATVALAANTYTIMYPPVGGPYKYQTVVVGQSGSSYNPLFGSQQILDADVPALLEDGWSLLDPSGDDWVGRAFFLDSYKPNADGVTDDIPALNKALSACTAAGGGTVFLGPKRYYVGSANLVIPSNCTLAGIYWPGGQRVSENFTTAPYTLVVNPSYTISVSTFAELRNVIVMRSGMAVFSTLPQSTVAVAAFSGTGITCGGNDCRVSNLLVLGFNQAFYSTNNQRPSIEGLYGDNTNGIWIDSAGDVGHIHNVHFWNFVTGNLGFTSANYAVTGVADNGSGLNRITIASTAQMTTGMTVYVTGTGVGAANGKFTVTVVDSTHFDEQGSVFVAPTITGNTTVGLMSVTNLSSTSGVAIGQGITGSGIPASTSISLTYASQSTIYLSSAATATATGVSLTLYNPTYSSGGTVYIDGSQRSGTAFNFTNEAGEECTNCFEWGYATGVHIGTGANGVVLTNVSLDNNAVLNDMSTVALLVDSGAYGNSWVGGYCDGYGVCYRGNSSTTQGATAISSILFGGFSGSTFIEANAGNVTISEVNTGVAAYAYISDSIASVVLNGCVMPFTVIEYMTQTGLAKVFSSTGNIMSNTGPPTGNGSQNTLTLGSAGMSQASALLISGNQNGDTNQGAQIKFNNTAAANSNWSIRDANFGGLQFLNNSYNTTMLMYQSGSVGLGGGSVDSGIGTLDVVNGFYLGAGKLFASGTAPTVSSGGGTAPVVTARSSNYFSVTEGSTGTPSATLVMTMPAAADGWSCPAVMDQTSGSITARQSANTTTSVTITFSAAPASGDVVVFNCGPF